MSREASKRLSLCFDALPGDIRGGSRERLTFPIEYGYRVHSVADLVRPQPWRTFGACLRHGLKRSGYTPPVSLIPPAGKSDGQSCPSLYAAARRVLLRLSTEGEVSLLAQMRTVGHEPGYWQPPISVRQRKRPCISARPWFSGSFWLPDLGSNQGPTD